MTRLRRKKVRRRKLAEMRFRNEEIEEYEINEWFRKFHNRKSEYII